MLREQLERHHQHYRQLRFSDPVLAPCADSLSTGASLVGDLFTKTLRGHTQGLCWISEWGNRLSKESERESKRVHELCNFTFPLTIYASPSYCFGAPAQIRNFKSAFKKIGGTLQGITMCICCSFGVCCSFGLCSGHWCMHLPVSPRPHAQYRLEKQFLATNQKQARAAMEACCAYAHSYTFLLLLSSI